MEIFPKFSEELGGDCKTSLCFRYWEVRSLGDWENYPPPETPSLQETKAIHIGLPLEGFCNWLSRQLCSSGISSCSRISRNSQEGAGLPQPAVSAVGVSRRAKNKTGAQTRARFRLAVKNRYWIVTGQGPPFGLDNVAEPNPAPPRTTPVIFADFFLIFGFLTSSPHS